MTGGRSSGVGYKLSHRGDELRTLRRSWHAPGPPATGGRDPGGKFGRPALIVTEPRSAKGVAFLFSRAITQQNLALFYLTLLGAAGLVGQSTYTSVKRRRSEFGMLRAIGWPRWRIALLVELELLLVAVVAGAIAALARPADSLRSE